MGEYLNNQVIESLGIALREKPGLWETRKKLAALLYESENYQSASDLIWLSPDLPGNNVELAFVLKMVSKVTPHRAYRLVYDIVRRNQNKPEKNLALAKALNDIGMYMEAARFYGAALAENVSLFDQDFEREMIWMDDSGILQDAYIQSDIAKELEHAKNSNLTEEQYNQGQQSQQIQPSPQLNQAHSSTPGHLISPIAKPPTLSNLKANTVATEHILPVGAPVPAHLRQIKLSQAPSQQPTVSGDISDHSSSLPRQGPYLSAQVVRKTSY